MSTVQNDNNDLFIEKRLRKFINRFYRVKIIQGLLFSLFIALIILIALVLIGNIIPITAKGHLIYFIVGTILVGIVFIYQVMRPIAQRMGWIKGLNFKEASQIISEKHHTVEDKIVNIIELAREKQGKNNVLYDHAIHQKSENIGDINFNDAVSVKKLIRFSLRLLTIAGIIAIIAGFWPDFVKKGMGTIWTTNQQIADLKEVQFTILNDSLKVEAGKDFPLRFTAKSGFPLGPVYVLLGSEFKATVGQGTEYEYAFKAVNTPVTFKLSANGIESEEYRLELLRRPGITGIQMIIVPPGYTRTENTVIEGSGNAEVAAASRIFWKIRGSNTDAMFMVFGKDTIPLAEKGKSWNYERIIRENADYEILSTNKQGLSINFFYRIMVVKDLYPTIDIAESRDSTRMSEVSVQGIIQDDYGFSKLEVVENREGNERVTELDIRKNRIYDNFYYTLQADTNQVEYYFRVWDNDWEAGPKFTESRRISLKNKSREELAQDNDALADSIKGSMKDGIEAIEKMEKKISEFRMEQLVGELKPWEVQERIKELNQLKNEVLDLLNSVQKADEEYTDMEQMLEQDQALAEQAREIQKLLESLLDDELKELLKQFEELAKEFNSKKADELSEQMQLNMEKLKEQMEMSLELLKKYDMEKDLLEQIDQLEKMADSLDTTKENSTGQEEQLQNKFEEWDKEYQEKLDEDKQLKKPLGLKDLSEEREEVKKDADELSKSDSGDSKEGKKSKASKSLKKLAGKMKDMLGIMKGEGMSVDLEDVRQIRNSLTDFSKKQEALNEKIVGINTSSPTFSTVIREQKVLEDKFLRIQDSLESIGYKQPMVAQMIGSELFHVETSFKNLFENYAENRANVVRIEQNRIMSEINSIAVKLDELIRSMENAKGEGSSEGSQAFTDRKKPKSGDKPGSEKLGETRSMQQSMKEQLKSAIQKMKSGNTGKKERGDMARMLGQREMMRKAMEKLLQDGGLGTEAREKANEALKMMKEVEKDIIYNRLSDQTLKKDELIRTRLLEAENAEKERENENRRESKEFKGTFEPNRKELGGKEDATKQMEQVLKYKELKLKKFYQEKYERYMDTIRK